MSDTFYKQMEKKKTFLVCTQTVWSYYPPLKCVTYPQYERIPTTAPAATATATTAATAATAAATTAG